MKKYFFIILFILLSLLTFILFNSDDTNKITDNQKSIQQIKNWKIAK